MRLPHCEYPKAADVERHGLQPLPETPPVADLAGAAQYRSERYRVIPAFLLDAGQLRQVSLVIGDSFARRDPISRHLRLPGDASMASALTDLVRSVFLAGTRADTVAQSVAIADDAGMVIGVAMNETLGYDAGPVVTDLEPVLAMLGEQEHTGVAALCAQYPDFRAALEQNKIAHLAMVARADGLPTEDAFELIAGTVESYQSLGFRYILTSAVNQWTGAAFSVLGGIPVHFEPFLVRKRVAESPVPVDVLSSPTGFLAGKDSGSMLYLLTL